MKKLPNKDDILAWIRENPGKSGKRDIARAFGIKGAQRTDLKMMLRDLQKDGSISRERRHFRSADDLPPVCVMRITAIDPGGDLIAEPQVWDGDSDAPKALFVPKKEDTALAVSDRFLARLSRVKDGDFPYEARLIRKLGDAPQRVLGIFRVSDEGGRLVSVDRKADREWMVPAAKTGGAQDGELVEAERMGKQRGFGPPRARIVQRLGDPMAPKSISLIAIHEHAIPDAFPDEVLAEAASAAPVNLGTRTDLRKLPLVTIDPADARDHDDAIAAFADDAADNPGGHILWVAIADVAHFVQPGSELDREAKKRGNSTYFPDRVVPMLPDGLSGDLCSLHEGVDRACLALEVRIDADGAKIGHRFVRGLMNSLASLTYEQAQAAADGKPDEATAPFVASVIAPLWAAYHALLRARATRQPLELDLPERKIVLSDDGKVTSVNFRDRFDAHKLVEEFMVLANVCAAETLEEKRIPQLYRVHEEPSPEKLQALRDAAQSMGLTLAKGQVLKTSHLNRLLAQAAETDHAEAINITVLRSMMQAYYGPKSLGHFGLALRRYAHFTSPIRRYADLTTHRALITAHGWAETDTVDLAELEKIGAHISQTERQSMLAERDTNDRYLSAFLADRIGSEFEGRIVGVARFGLFVKLLETGADGLIPVSSLGREYFRFDDREQTLKGEDSGQVLGVGQLVTVRIEEAVPVTGGLLFQLLSVEGKALRQVRGKKGRKSGAKRKVVRRKRG